MFNSNQQSAKPLPSWVWIWLLVFGCFVLHNPLFNKIQSWLLTSSLALQGDCTLSTFFLLGAAYFLCNKVWNSKELWVLQSWQNGHWAAYRASGCLSPKSGVWLLPLITWEIGLFSVHLWKDWTLGNGFLLVQITRASYKIKISWLMLKTRAGKQSRHACWRETCLRSQMRVWHLVSAWSPSAPSR